MVLDVFKYCVSLKTFFCLFLFFNEEFEVQNIDSG